MRSVKESTPPSVSRKREGVAAARAGGVHEALEVGARVLAHPHPSRPFPPGADFVHHRLVHDREAGAAQQRLPFHRAVGAHVRWISAALHL
jgi:hypothetical protein